MSGYSATPLAKKLGIKPGFKIRLIYAPEYYFHLFTDLPENIQLLNEEKSKKNFIHLFAKRMTDLDKNILEIKSEIKEDGIIWVSWYKKASKILTDVTEDKIREVALANGVVDIKVCAIDEVWSGLKLVIPVKSRKRKS